MRLPNWPRWVWRCYAATFAGLTVFVVCSVWPMWELEHCNQREGLIESHTLWGLLARIEYTPRTGGSWVEYHWETPAITTGVAMHIAAIVGALLGGVRWRKGEETSPPVPLSEPERGCSTP